MISLGYYFYDGERLNKTAWAYNRDAGVHTAGDLAKDVLVRLWCLDPEAATGFLVYPDHLSQRVPPGESVDNLPTEIVVQITPAVFDRVVGHTDSVTKAQFESSQAQNGPRKRQRVTGDGVSTDGGAPVSAQLQPAPKFVSPQLGVQHQDAAQMEVARQIVECLKENQVAEVKQLLEDTGRDPSEVSAQDCEARLHWAAKAGLLEVAYVLLQEVVNATDQIGDTPLHLAVQHDTPEMALLLLQHGADANARDQYERTPLHRCAYKNTEAVKLLLQYGADVNAQDEDGDTTLNCVSLDGCTELAKLLLALGADPSIGNKAGNTPLHMAAENGQDKVVRALLDFGAGVSTQDQEGKTALHHAASNGHVSVVQMLLEHGADVDACDQADSTALHVAASKGHKHVTMLLLENAARVNSRTKDGSTPLHEAVTSGHSEVVELLLLNGADANTQNKALETPLHCAADAGRTIEAQLLLRHHADLHAKDKNQRTPSECALMRGREHLAQLLLPDTHKPAGLVMEPLYVRQL